MSHIISHLTMKPGHNQLGLAAGWNEPYLDAVVVAEDQQQRHDSARHVCPVTVEAGVVDVRRLEPGPGHLALGVLAGLVEGLDLINKS